VLQRREGSEFLQEGSVFICGQVASIGKWFSWIIDRTSGYYYEKTDITYLVAPSL
jgi:hypothetical protein